MGRASKAAEAYIAVLDRVVETLDDVLSRERGLSPILEMRDAEGNVIGGGGGREAGGITRSGSSRTTGTHRAGGRERDREINQQGRDDLAAWNAYVRAGGSLNFERWKAMGRPGATFQTGIPFGLRPTPTGSAFPSSSGGAGAARGSSGQSVQVRDDATAAEVRGLRGDIRRNGGFL